MARIKINPEILQAAGSKIHNQMTELNGFNTKLNALLDEIKDSWDGKSSQQYYNLMQTYRSKAVHMESILAAFKKYSDTAINKFETLDQQCANKINGSF